jgi:lysine-ketoglutarate reductase/saccharopine dehydrogenase-like protein (TIGR00300 family)
MSFTFPKYNHPDFEKLNLLSAPDAAFEAAEMDGVAPENYHSTSVYPEYVKVNGQWLLAEESRMDSCIVLNDDSTLSVIEARNLKKGHKVILGRTERGEEGIYVHTKGFEEPQEEKLEDQFVFRQGRSRETSFARDYDRLFDLLKHEKDHGNILWVMGPAFAFDEDARRAMRNLIDNGYVHGVLAGNALATHDLEGALLHTALGQDIYTQKSQPGGHYNHLDVCNKVRRCGSIPKFLEEYKLDDGIMAGCVKNNIPFVLAGSIRDDGPLPEVIGNAYEAALQMRSLVKKATTVICMATMLHTIATGNMTPSFRVLEDGTIRPIYLYAIDNSEFVVNKLQDRGSLTSTAIVTNVQDFITLVSRGLGLG